MSYRKIVAVAVSAALGATLGCAKEPPAEKHNTNAAKPANAPPPAGATVSAEVLLRTRAALSHYETIRAALAADDLQPVAAAAKKLANVAKIAAEKSKGSAKSSLDGITKGANDLQSKTDIEEARLAFGEVSKHVVALIANERALQRDHHVFECPMAKGYKKWVQTKSALENPYMGKKMLGCGSQIEWSS